MPAPLLIPIILGGLAAATAGFGVKKDMTPYKIVEKHKD